MLNNVRYIVGEKVIQDQLKGTEVEKKSNKSTDELMVITILSGLAVSAMRQSPTSSHINIRYDLSVALPMQLITQEIVLKMQNVIWEIIRLFSIIRTDAM